MLSMSALVKIRRFPSRMAGSGTWPLLKRYTILYGLQPRVRATSPKQVPIRFVCHESIYAMAFIFLMRRRKKKCVASCIARSVSGYTALHTSQSWKPRRRNCPNRQTMHGCDTLVGGSPYGPIVPEVWTGTPARGLPMPLRARFGKPSRPPRLVSGMPLSRISSPFARGIAARL